MVTHHADTCRHAHSESMSCSIGNSELLFDNGAMEYVSTTYGERRRVHREYVDVYARFGRDGAIEPVCIMWKDGRSFSVDEVIESSGFGIMSRGRQTARYRVRFGRHPPPPRERKSGSCGGSTPMPSPRFARQAARWHTAGCEAEQAAEWAGGVPMIDGLAVTSCSKEHGMRRQGVYDRGGI